MADIIVTETSVNFSKELTRAESEIRKANKSFLVIGKYLTIINEKELYKERNFPTFELYVQSIFDFTRDYAYKIMRATKIYDTLAAKFKPSELPRSETHCRPLCRLETDKDVIAVWENVVKAGKVTAKVVTEFTNQYLGKATITQKGKEDGEPGPDTGNDEKPGTPEANPSSATPDGKPTGDDVKGETQLSTDQEIAVLKQEITRLEAELEKARAVKGGIAKTKMARKMIQAGFAALSKTVTDEQKEELIATKKSLLG